MEIEVTHVSSAGELEARIVDYDGADEPILMLTGRRVAELKQGSHALAKLTPIRDNLYAALVIRKLEIETVRVLGVLRLTKEGARVQPTDKKAKTEFFVPHKFLHGAGEGELVLVEVQPARRLGLPEAKVIERVGNIDDPKAFSLIAIYENNIPVEFPAAAVAQAEAAQPVTLGTRTDLRAVPLVTIDGEDARDFDDAVFAEPDPEVTGGWHLLVAIADVAHYVTPESALDESAQNRGNSVYFPDRVVPMLPEALSNELCSLKPNVERATMAVHLWIDAEGQLTRWQFVRGLMRSHARLTYNQVQAAIEGRPDAVCAHLWDPLLKNLYHAYQTLKKARRARGTLELDVPEYKARFDAGGRVVAIDKRLQQEAHMLIEEFMISANVAAALALENKGNIAVYRVHDQPSDEKREALADFLASLGTRLPKGQRLTSKGLSQILHSFKDRPEAPLLNEVMLRSQSQACYATENIGHFGLALQHYAHFTSPIRRYADLLVHRALVKVLRLGDDGLPPSQMKKLADIAEHISVTERRAAQAERSAGERYIAAYLADRVGATFAATISGVANFGIFVRLVETGADGLIPMRALGDDYFIHDEATHSLHGRRTGLSYQLGQPLTVQLQQAEGVTGRLLFSPVLPEGLAVDSGSHAKRSKNYSNTNKIKEKRAKRNARDGRESGGKKRR